MKSILVSFFLMLPLFAARPVAAAAVDSSEGEPAYKMLYEQGFYSEAIVLLDTLIARDTAGNRELLFYLAASHIARGDNNEGAAVFGRIFAADPGYRLDTILTPPKILEVFRSVQANRASVRNDSGAARGGTDTYATTARSDLPAKTVAATEVAERQIAIGPAIEKSGPPRNLDTVDVGPHPVLRYSFGLLPGGVGQFYERKPVRGALLLAVQAAAAAGCYWAYRTRESYYEGGAQGRGWYEGNKASYRRYTGYAWVGAGILIGSYTFGVIDYFRDIPGERPPY